MKELPVRRTRRCCSPEGPFQEGQYPRLGEGAKLFRALADETRLAIVRQLAEQGEVCACNFLTCYDLAQPTVSHHLKMLREAGLVDTEKRGLWVYYRLNREKVEVLRSWLPGLPPE